MSAEVFPDLIDMKFPDRSSSSRKKHTNNIEIDFNSLIAQGLQRDRDKEAKNRRRRNAGGGPRRQLEDQKIFFKMRAILKLMRKQEIMFIRITKLMREIIELHDFSADYLNVNR